ncbi:hypothetical protein Mapa_006699 [Marchantia paleacea]|nr:hypothetical protein Mapa_006699 [Marchantia paleacea]
MAWMGKYFTSLKRSQKPWLSVILYRYLKHTVVGLLTPEVATSVQLDRQWTIDVYSQRLGTSIQQRLV